MSAAIRNKSFVVIGGTRRSPNDDGTADVRVLVGDLVVEQPLCLDCIQLGIGLFVVEVVADLFADLVLSSACLFLGDGDLYLATPGHG